MKTYVPLDALPDGLYPKYREFAEAAMSDGWTLNHGPWSTIVWSDGGITSQIRVTEGDRSVTLTRDDFVIWLVDRDLENKYRGAWTEHWMSAWAANGQHAITVPETYDGMAIVDAKGSCHYCHKVVGKARLRSISFAGKICDTCDDTKPELRMAAEPPGWYN
jgi:hypothetical protein